MRNAFHCLKSSHWSRAFGKRSFTARTNSSTIWSFWRQADDADLGLFKFFRNLCGPAGALLDVHRQEGVDSGHSIGQPVLESLGYGSTTPARPAQEHLHGRHLLSEGMDESNTRAGGAGPEVE